MKNIEYVKEKYLENINEEDEKNEIIRNIINTRYNLKVAHTNFDLAESREQIDYYIFKIKTIQKQLNCLIKTAKNKNIDINKIA